MSVRPLLSFATLLGSALLGATFLVTPVRAEMVGPWNVVPYKNGSTFKHCIMGRGENGAVPAVGFTRNNDYYTIFFLSKAWKMTAGQSFTAKLTVGTTTETLNAFVAEPTLFLIDMIKSPALQTAVRQAASVTVTVPMGTYTVPLAQSGPTFAAFDTCLAQNITGPVAARPATPAPAQPATPAPQAAPSGNAGGKGGGMSDVAYSMVRADCEQIKDRDIQIVGCTKVIESGREQQAVVGIAHSNRADAYSAKKDYAHALADFSTAIQLNPTYVNAHWGRGDVYFEMNSFPQAITDYGDAIKLSPSDDTLYRSRALARFRIRDYGNAIDDYAAALRLKPNTALYYAERGDVYAARNDRPRALADYDAALRIDPNQKTAQEGRARLQGGGRSAAPVASGGSAPVGFVKLSIEQYADFVHRHLSRNTKVETDKNGDYVAKSSARLLSMYMVRNLGGSFDDSITAFVGGLRKGCVSFGPHETVKQTKISAIDVRMTEMACRVGRVDMTFQTIYATDGQTLHIYSTFGTSKRDVERTGTKLYGGLDSLYR
ncbi:MAG TPA: tetratricopeptide repeat protein [Xanthobacteraceae bacterium]|jgi:tetratricopeptide (TPR) repeat protein|nr:tetratricopeptide repeat protein [Xanthobacteraceae bacterium]